VLRLLVADKTTPLLLLWWLVALQGMQEGCLFPHATAAPAAISDAAAWQQWSSISS
jgi:hypothetical protein